MEIGSKVWKIELRKYRDASKFMTRDDGVNIEELTVLGVSDVKIVFNNRWFSSIDIVRDKKDKKYYTYLDEVYVNVVTESRFSDEGVFSTLYSTNKPDKVLLKKMVTKINKEVSSKYSFLFWDIKNDLTKYVNEYDYEKI